MRRDQTLEEGLDDLGTNNRTPRPCTTHRLTIERGSHLGLGTSLHSSSTLGFQGGGGGLYIGQPRAKGKTGINRKFWALHGPGPTRGVQARYTWSGDSGVMAGDSGLDRRLRSGPETPVNLRCRLRRGILTVPGTGLGVGPEMDRRL